MISLIAFIFCLILLIAGLVQNHSSWAIIVYAICVVLNIPGVVLFFTQK